MDLAVFWFGFAIATACVARFQGRPVLPWLLVGCLGGVFAFFWLTALPVWNAIRAGRRPGGAAIFCTACDAPLDPEGDCPYCRGASSGVRT